MTRSQQQVDGGVADSARQRQRLQVVRSSSDLVASGCAGVHRVDPGQERLGRATVYNKNVTSAGKQTRHWLTLRWEVVDTKMSDIRSRLTE